MVYTVKIRILEFADLSDEDTRLCIGAMCRRLMLEKREVVKEHCGLLSDAIRFVAHPAIHSEPGN